MGEKETQRMRRPCGVLTGGEGAQWWPESYAAGKEVEQIEEMVTGSRSDHYKNYLICEAFSATFS
jgi:hypothetical protein